MSFNRVVLLGRLGADPELRYTNSQLPVTSLRLATNDRRKGADGQWTETTEWHSVVVFGKTAENCAQYLKKGREALIEGRIQTRKWQDKEGNDRYRTEVIAQTVQFIGGRGGSDVPMERSSKSDDDFDFSAAAGQSGGSASVSFDDDDIPF